MECLYTWFTQNILSCFTFHSTVDWRDKADNRLARDICGILPWEQVVLFWVDISSQQGNWYWEMEMKLNFWHSVRVGGAWVERSKDVSLRRVRGNEVSGSKIHKYWRRSEKAKESKIPSALGKGLDFEDSREGSWLMKVLLYPNQPLFIKRLISSLLIAVCGTSLGYFLQFTILKRKIKRLMIPTRKKLLFSHC